MTTQIPEGFKSIGEEGLFLGHIGGIHWRPVEGGAQTCIVIEPHHCNPFGTTHGGLLMTLLDITLGATAHGLMAERGGGVHPLTVQQTTSFMKPARQGELLMGYGVIESASPSIIFVGAKLMVEDRLVATASGVFRLPAPRN